MNNKTKIIICGGRDFNNYHALEFAVDKILAKNKLSYRNIEIVSGHALGADSLGEEYAKNHNISLAIFPADWTKYRKAAGPIRNKQMIDYIKNSKDSLVIAFVGPNSIGTKNTISLAKKENIKTYEIDYNFNNEVFSDLTEGIRLENGEVKFDFNSDDADDIIKVCGININMSKLNSKTYFFGYRVNKLANKDDRHKILDYIKCSDSAELDLLIDRSIELLYQDSEIKKFDYLIQVPSSSEINNKISNTIISKYEPNCIKIVATKLPTASLTLKTDLINKSFKYNDLTKVYDFFNDLKASLQKDNSFSISKINPKYRRYFKSMIKFNNTNIINSENINILIIDDILTTSSSIGMIIDELEEMQFKGTITVFSLINNK